MSQTPADPVVGVLDTCVVIDAGLGLIDLDLLPDVQLITAITLGELAFGSLAAESTQERAVRQIRLHRTEVSFGDSVLPYDADAARAYGGVCASVVASGRSTRRRVADLQIAAIAVSRSLPLFTVSHRDFVGIDALLLVPLERNERSGL